MAGRRPRSGRAGCAAATYHTLFALKAQTPRQQPFLVAVTDLDDPATDHVVVDPDAIDPSGETAIDFFVPSPDGKQVAVALSEHGTDDGSLYVYDADSGKVVDEPDRACESDVWFSGLASRRRWILVHPVR
jgi:prolyl oligopeptidase family protein